MQVLPAEHGCNSPCRSAPDHFLLLRQLHSASAAARAPPKTSRRRRARVTQQPLGVGPSHSGTGQGTVAIHTPRAGWPSPNGPSGARPTLNAGPTTQASTMIAAECRGDVGSGAHDGSKNRRGRSFKAFSGIEPLPVGIGSFTNGMSPVFEAFGYLTTVRSVQTTSGPNRDLVGKLNSPLTSTLFLLNFPLTFQVMFF